MIYLNIYLVDEAYPSFKYCPDLVTDTQGQFFLHADGDTGI